MRLVPVSTIKNGGNEAFWAHKLHLKIDECCWNLYYFMTFNNKWNIKHVNSIDLFRAIFWGQNMVFYPHLSYYWHHIRTTWWNTKIQLQKKRRISTAKKRSSYTVYNCNLPRLWPKKKFILDLQKESGRNVFITVYYHLNARYIPARQHFKVKCSIWKRFSVKHITRSALLWDAYHHTQICFLCLYEKTNNYTSQPQRTFEQTYLNSSANATMPRTSFWRTTTLKTLDN